MERDRNLSDSQMGEAPARTACRREKRQSLHITHRSTAVKALTYQSSRNVSVQTVPDPVLEQEDDILLRVTATAICGSDLHIYRGKIPSMESGDILGHEFMGIVEETGRGVTRLKKGDRVVVPFTIACGQCFFCNKALFAAC
jgi:threonine dehydrogenase-like Zn-dependent dehydrogenase